MEESANRHNTDASDAVIARLHNLHPKLIDLSLDRLLRLLERLGHPQNALPPVFHVAGTNGKGSTSAILRACIEAAGYTAHVYTSPHLVRFHERIRVAGQLIGEDRLADLLEEVEKAAGDDPITFFEVTTAAALLAFSRAPADVVILEVGLGGRLDATNVVGKPAISIITPVGLDHQQFLGDTLGEIALEKAGILKAGCVGVIAPQHADADRAIRAQASIVGSPLLRFGDDWRTLAPASKPTFFFEDHKGGLELPRPALAGPHQIVNAGTAVAALRAQNVLSIPDAALRAGLEWARWPARLQDLTPSPLKDLLPDGSRILLDGGHNPAAAEVICDHLKTHDPVEEPITLILGMMERKDIAGFMAPLAGLGAQVIAVPIEGHEEGVATPGTLAAAATDAGLSGWVAASVPAALKRVQETAKPDTRPVVLIGGSLYLAGNVLKDIGWYPQ